MDKRWRNLGILVLVVAVVLVIYFVVVPSFFPPADEAGYSELGYSEILTLFEKNGVSLENFQTLNLVVINDSGEVVWVEDSQDLTKLRTDLVKFQASSSKYKGASSELKAASGVYISAIDFAFAQELRLKKISTVFSDGVNCALLPSIQDVNTQISDSFIGLYNLAVDVDNFASEYDPYSELILIDLDEEHYDMVVMQSSLGDIFEACAEGA